MTDDRDAAAADDPSANPFDQLHSEDAGAALPVTSTENASANAFDAIPESEPSSSASGAFSRAAARGVAPAIGGLAAAGAGAEVGAGIGGGIGAFFGGVGAAPGAAIGAFVGGVGGMLAGGYATSAAQDYALSKAPDSWVEALGQDDRQQQLDQKAHPYASFLGGIAPYAVTMRPGGFAKAVLPDNATAFQRIMANPMTARVFGGAAMGGMELGQEAVQGQSPDWSKVAISTGFGMVFNKPTRFGEAITEMGARPVRTALGVGSAPAALDTTEPDSAPPLTVSQASDAKVIGPGITEDVFQGAHEQNSSAAMAAQDTARSEQSLINPKAPEPDLHAVARQMEPELFQQYDALSGQREALRSLVEQHNSPPADATIEMEMQRRVLQDRLDTIPTSGAGRNLPEARRVRAQIRDVQSQIDAVDARRAAFAEGDGGDTLEASIARQHLLDTDYKMRDMAGNVSAAYRRAADAAGSGILPAAAGEPTVADGAIPPYKSLADMIAGNDGARPQKATPAVQSGGDDLAPAPRVSEAVAVPDPLASQASAAGRSVEQQRDFIANDVSRRLVRAGRPAEEAEATGQLLAARYLTRAARFDGALGSAEDLYSGTTSAIKGPGGKAALPSGVVDVQQTRASGPRQTTAPQTLKAFLRAAGGLKDDGGELRARDMSRTDPGLVNNRAGLSLDRAREMAAEAGYLGADTTRAVSETGVNDLLEALDKDKVYSVHDQEVVLDRQAKDAARAAPEHADIYDQNFQSGSPDEYPSDFFAGMPIDDHGMMMFQGARGSIRFVNGKRPVISLMKDANASTFIHETGHQWLEEMMADGEHPAAPSDVKADAQTVRDWLGVDSADAIKTRQHEKFARGFEQYMREGIAPSPQLAGVFGKFKNWLTSIYQTMRGLGMPINEDIRGVFDRLLSTDPQRTVVAPERTIASSMADVHEADAREAEPIEAEPSLDRVVSERDRAINELLPEIERELTAEIAQIRGREAAEIAQAEDARRGSGRPDVSGGGDAAGNVTGGSRNSAGSGSLVSGSSRPRQESDGVSGGERSSDGGDAGSQHPLAPGPSRLFGPAKSQLVDKAGNVRLDTLTNNEDVRAAIRESAAANNDFIGDRRGVVTDGQVMDLADALGMDAGKLAQRKIGQAFNAEQVVAARKLLIESATGVSDAMKKAATGTDQDVMAYAEAKDRHQMIQAQVAGITAEAGRALRAFRSMAGEEQPQAVDQFIKSATGKTLFQLREEAKLGSALETPEQVSKFMQDAQKRTFGRMVLEYWINGLISGPATHTTYAIGNTLLALQKAGPETAVAAGIGALRSALGREGETVRLGEVGAQLRGAAAALAPSLKASMDAFRTGVTTQLPGEDMLSGQGTLPFQPGSELAQPAKLDEAAGFRDVMSTAFGAVRGMRDGLVSGASVLAAGGADGAPLIGLRDSPLGMIPDVTLGGVNVLPIGSTVRLPGRFIAAIHSFFRSVNYSMEKNAQAFRMASNEGLQGDALAARVGDLRQNPPEALMDSARDVSTQLTLMGQGSQFVQALGKLTNTEIFGFPMLKFIDPFVHIAGNVMDQSIVQRSPLGLLAPEIRADLRGDNGTIAQDKTTAKMLVGTALSVTFGGLAAEGMISGSGPDKPNESAMWRLAGNQAHSVRIGDMWYDVHRLGPMGMLMGISADMYEVAHLAEQGEMLLAAAALQHAYVQNIFDESFMKGPADLIKAVEDPGRYGESYLKNFASSFVPFSVGMSQMARSADPYSRQARTVVDAIRSKVPGLSEGLFPRRDIWGEPMVNHDAVGAKGVTAIYETQMSHDAVNGAMLRLGIYPAPVEKKIRNVQLTDQQYDDFSRIAGRMTKMRLDAIVNSPDYQQWPDHAQHDVMAEVVKQSRETARGMMMMKYPQIVHDATSARIAAIHGDPSTKH